MSVLLQTVPDWPETNTALLIPDDPEWLALRLPRHRSCKEDVTGHDGCVWEARRLLRALRESTQEEKA